MPDGTTAPGGPSLYNARMALALGAEVTLMTALPDPGERGGALGAVRVEVVAAGELPEYENRYTADGRREQWLRAEGAPFPRDWWGAVPAADALVLAPAYRELTGAPPRVSGLLAVELQGLLRSRDHEGRVVPRTSPELAVAPFVVPEAWFFLSDEDTDGVDGFAAGLIGRGVNVVVTRAALGATSYVRGEVRSWSACPARAVDPTGAGDAFAATFVVRLAETGDWRGAMCWALAAGALATEGRGLDGIPTRAAVQARACQEAA